MVRVRVRVRVRVWVRVRVRVRVRMRVRAGVVAPRAWRRGKAVSGRLGRHP